jgi:MFS family permease
MASQISESTKIKFSTAFQRLWTASAASNLADGLLKTAAPLLATTLTKDPVWISTIAALGMLPWLFFAIPIGGLVDRINRRTMLAVANSFRLIAVLIIAITTGLELITLPILLGAVFIFGVGEVIYDTTLQSMVPEVLTKDQLDRGNARLQIVGITLAEFVGAPVSGLLFAASIALPFYFGAGGILLAVFLVLAIPRAYSIAPVAPSTKASTGFWEDVRFGIRYLYEDKVLLKLVLLTSSIGFFFSASSSTMVLFLTETLQTPVALFGFIFAATAVGALVGSLIVPKLSERFGRTTTMAWSIFLSSVMVVIQGFSPNYLVAAALMGLSSTVITGWNILLMSTYHQIIPGELFGRIHGTRRTLVWGLMPIGALLGGVLASIDLRLPFIAGGIACSVLALWGFRFVVNLETAWTKKD